MHVSIVVPCFNAERYLCACLDSALAQSYVDFEIVCVDDCSTDSTWEILQEYSRKDNRVRIFRLNENSGSAKYPRDYAVSQAGSELICSLDSDDWLEDDYLQKMVTRQREVGVDIVYSRMVFRQGDDDDKSDITIPKVGFDMNQVLSGRQALNLTLGRWQISANGALIARTIWLAQSRYLDAGFNHMNADEFATREMLARAGQVAFVDAHYFYRKHTGAITANPNRQFETLHTDAAMVELFRRIFGSSSPECRMMTELVLGRMLAAARGYYAQSIQFPEKEEMLRSWHQVVPCADVLRARLPWKVKVLSLLPFPLLRAVMKRRHAR